MLKSKPNRHIRSWCFVVAAAETLRQVGRGEENREKEEVTKHSNQLEVERVYEGNQEA